MDHFPYNLIASALSKTVSKADESYKNWQVAMNDKSHMQNIEKMWHLAKRKTITIDFYTKCMDLLKELANSMGFHFVTEEKKALGLLSSVMNISSASRANTIINHEKERE